MKIVAFLQNMWVRDPERLRRMLAERDEEFRRAMCKKLLFAGCVTGRRLRAALGDLCDSIIWEECTREIAGDPRTILPPQPEHIRAVLTSEKPDVVVTFGKVAETALRGIWRESASVDVFLPAKHPAARVGVKENLAALAHDLGECKRWYDFGGTKLLKGDF